MYLFHYGKYQQYQWTYSDYNNSDRCNLWHRQWNTDTWSSNRGSSTIYLFNRWRIVQCNDKLYKSCSRITYHRCKRCKWMYLFHYGKYQQYQWTYSDYNNG